jgi:hypothetical protein
MEKATSFGKMDQVIKDNINMVANTEKERSHLFQRSVMLGYGQMESKTGKE